MGFYDCVLMRSSTVCFSPFLSQLIQTSSITPSSNIVVYMNSWQLFNIWSDTAPACTEAQQGRMQRAHEGVVRRAASGGHSHTCRLVMSAPSSYIRWRPSMSATVVLVHSMGSNIACSHGTGEVKRRAYGEASRAQRRTAVQAPNGQTCGDRNFVDAAGEVVAVTYSPSARS